MAVVATSRLAAVEGDCRRAIFPRHASVGHHSLGFVLHAEDPAERDRLPAFCQAWRVTGAIRWIGKGDIVSEERERFGEGERGAPMNGRKFAGVEGRDVLLERAQAFGICFDEVGPDRTPRQCLEAEGAGASVEIEHSRLGQVQLEDAHPGFADAIEGRPYVSTTGCADSPSAPAAGDYAHFNCGKREAGSGKRERARALLVHAVLSRRSAIRAWRYVSPR